MGDLGPREARFVDALTGETRISAAEAIIEAGYTGVAAKQQAYKLVHRPRVAAAIAERRRGLRGLKDKAVARLEEKLDSDDERIVVYSADTVLKHGATEVDEDAANRHPRHYTLKARSILKKAQARALLAALRVGPERAAHLARVAMESSRRLRAQAAGMPHDQDNNGNADEIEYKQPGNRYERD